MRRQVKHFVVELSCGWVAQKHGVGLDSKYKLPKMVSKGQIQGQRIRRKGADLSKMAEVEKEESGAAEGGGGGGGGGRNNRVLVEEVAGENRTSSSKEDEPTFALRVDRGRKSPNAPGKLPSSAEPANGEGTAANDARSNPAAAAAAAGGAGDTSHRRRAVGGGDGPSDSGAPAGFASTEPRGRAPTAGRRGAAAAPLRHHVQFPDRPATRAIVTVTLGVCAPSEEASSPSASAGSSPAGGQRPEVRVQARGTTLRVACTLADAAGGPRAHELDVLLPLCIDTRSTTARLLRGEAVEEDLRFLNLAAPGGTAAGVGTHVWRLEAVVPFVTHTEHLERMRKLLPHSPGEISFKSAAATIL